MENMPASFSTYSFLHDVENVELPAVQKKIISWNIVKN
jgi:hypothetical protein